MSAGAAQRRRNPDTKVYQDSTWLPPGGRDFYVPDNSDGEWYETSDGHWHPPRIRPEHDRWHQWWTTVTRMEGM
jgi:hypothetical protein